MLLDGHFAQLIVERLGLSGTNVLYRWKVSNCRVAVPWQARWNRLCGNLRRNRVCGSVMNSKNALAIFGRKELAKSTRRRLKQSPDRGLRR